MKRLFTAFSLLFLCAAADSVQAQTQQKHFIYFRDKANTPYSITKPAQYLSEAALKRRSKQKISIKERDLPVNPTYVAGVKNLGVEVL